MGARQGNSAQGSRRSARRDARPLGRGVGQAVTSASLWPLPPVLVQREEQGSLRAISEAAYLFVWLNYSYRTHQVALDHNLLRFLGASCSHFPISLAGPTMKLKRLTVLEKYKDTIEAFYRV